MSKYSFLEGWSTAFCQNCEGYVYGYEESEEQVKEFANCCYSPDLEFVEIGEFSDEPVFHIIDNIFEDANYHRWVGLPKKVFNIMRNETYSSEEADELVERAKIVCQAFYEAMD